MKRILFASAALILLLATPRVSKGDEVSFDFFYNNLSGGSWVEVGDYGYCWQPDVSVNDRNWRPYSDGYWAYTDLGWTWISYEDFGWATYHYGRWVMLDDYGWVWAPGRDTELEWGPAWVSWRTGGDYIGWAPLPPEVTISGNVITAGIDAEYDIGPAYYNFVEVRYIGEPVIRERIVPVTQNVTYITQTVNITNITVKNKVVYNYGPDLNVINQRSARPIQRLKLERQENVDVSAAAKSGALTKVQGDKLMVSAPMTIKKSAQLPPPPAVKARVTQPKINKGWSVVSDPKLQAELKQKIKTEDRTKTQIGAGTGINAGASTNVGPNAATNAAASPEQGQGRRGGAQNMTGNSPGPAMVPKATVSPAQGLGTESAGPDGRRGQGGHNRFPQGPATSPAPNAANGATEQSQEGSGQGGRARQREMQDYPTGQGGGRGQGAEDQGREGRRLQGQPGQAAPGDAQGQGGGGRHPQEQGQGTGQGGQGEHSQGQGGQGQGSHGKKGQGQGTPAPTPQ